MLFGVLCTAALASAASAALDLSRAFPAPNAREVPPDAPLRIRFPSTPKLAEAGKIAIHDADTGAIVDTVDLAAPLAEKKIGGMDYQYYQALVTGNEIVLSPAVGTVGYGKTYFVTLEAGIAAIGEDSSAAITDATAWRFSTRQAPPATGAARYVVAADGTGDFCTVQGAIDFVPAENARPVTLELKRGVYVEMVNVPKGKNRITIHGTERKGAIIRYPNNARFNPRVRSLVDVYADDFRLENLTLHNTTPRGGSQAESLRVRADRCILEHCDFSSLQDTLQLTGRVYLNDCYVEGDVDFVWGSGTVYFNRCELKALNNGYLVQSRNGADRLGYIFVDCRLTATPNVTRYILARIEPSRFPYSHVAFLDCTMGDHISPGGWQFDRVPNAKELGAIDHEQFQEFHSLKLDGKPVDTSQRIAPSRQLTPAEATKLRDVAFVLAGQDD